MFGITDPTTYVIGAAAIILLPGPNSMFCLTVAGQYGVKPAYRALLAIMMGDAVLLLATALGAGSLLKAVPELFHLIKMVGGLYLAWIGWHLLRGAAKKWHLRHAPPSEHDAPKPAVQHVFKRALVLSLTNPKAILFLLSFFVQFVDPNYTHPLLTFLILSLILQLFSFVYLNVLVFAGHGLTHAFRRHTRISAVCMGFVGLMFMGFAVNMWMA